MGISDCLLFSSKNLIPMDSNTTSKPTSEFQELDQEREQKEENGENSVSSLTIKTPSTTALGEFTVGEGELGGDTCTTPTSTDQRIPLILSCPPAPRKPKPAKRKAADSRRIFRLDFSSEVEALFPPSVIADFGCKIKKARQND